MSDVALNFANNQYDIDVFMDDLTIDPGLETAVSISIFTDKRVTNEELPSGHTSKRGWWGDMYPDIEQDQIGSRLWTLFPGKTTSETMRKSEDYTKESLKWLIDDGIASEIVVSSEYNTYNHLVINISILKPNGITSRYSINWDEQEIKRG